MSGFVVTLDTRPPVVSWGTHAWLPEEGRIEATFQVNEPDVYMAWASVGTLTYPAQIAGDVLSAMLPPDAAGEARLHIITRDDVMNEGEYMLPIYLGAAPPVVVTTRGRMPQSPPVPRVRYFTSTGTEITAVNDWGTAPGTLRRPS